MPSIVRARTMSPTAIGAVSDALVSTVDVFATVAELARVPSSAISAQDSVSLLPYLYGQPRSLRATVYSEGFVPNFPPLAITGGAPANYYCERHFQTLRNSRFKLIRRWKRDHQNPAVVVLVEEFYDLLRGGPLDTSTQPATQYPDPHERNDLLKSGIAPGSVEARTLPALRLDLDTLRIESSTLIATDLRTRFSDLIASVEVAGRPALIYLLFEHVSTSHALMPLRLFGYVHEALPRRVALHGAALLLPRTSFPERR